LEQRRRNRLERRDRREEAERQNQEPEHEKKLREKKCERPRCRGDEAIIKHICRECNAEACDDCRTDHKHKRANRDCTTETWERAPTRSDYTTGLEHVGLTIRNRFDEGTRRGEVLGYLTHRGEKWYLVKWDLGQEMEIDEDMFTDCRLAEVEHDRDGTEPEQNTIEQGRRGYRPPEPRERKEEKEGKEESPPALEEPQAVRRSEQHRTKETRKDRSRKRKEDDEEQRPEPAEKEPPQKKKREARQPKEQNPAQVERTPTKRKPTKPRAEEEEERTRKRQKETKQNRNGDRQEHNENEGEPDNKKRSTTPERESPRDPH
jgi:hypothetical protein